VVRRRKAPLVQSQPVNTIFGHNTSSSKLGKLGKTRMRPFIAASLDLNQRISPAKSDSILLAPLRLSLSGGITKRRACFLGNANITSCKKVLLMDIFHPSKQHEAQLLLCQGASHWSHAFFYKWPGCMTTSSTTCTAPDGLLLAQTDASQQCTLQHLSARQTSNWQLEE
jgi:hypothetical protein